MLLKLNHLNQAMALFGMWLGWYFGSMDGLLSLLIAVVMADYVSGVLRAFYENKLSSRVGRHGITKKVMIFVLVGIANLLDAHVFNMEHTVIRTATICFFVSNEGLSILENAVAMGLRVPESLKKSLKQIQEEPTREDDKKQ